MPTMINYGTLNYSIESTPGSLTSNAIATELNVTYTATLTKTSYSSTFAPGDTLVYQFKATNTGTGTLYNPRFVDDLGTETYGTPLDYVEGSVTAFLYNAAGTVVSPLQVTVTETASNVTFNMVAVMPTGYYVIITYSALVDATLEPSVVSILNEATFRAAEGGFGGAALTVTVTEAVNRETVTMVKSANKTQVSPGDTLNYIFTLTNIGNKVVDISNLTDQLPANFQINNTISAVIGSNPAVTYTLNTDYTVSATHLLTIDPAAASTQLTIPAATATDAGTTVITIGGSITE